MTPPPDYTPAQLSTYEVLQRIRMAWVALWFALGLFTIATLTFLVALFVLSADAPSKAILGIIDSIVGATLFRVYAYLFPTPKGAVPDKSINPKKPPKAVAAVEDPKK